MIELFAIIGFCGLVIATIKAVEMGKETQKCCKIKQE